jgi:hypothetical protein
MQEMDGTFQKKFPSLATVSTDNLTIDPLLCIKYLFYWIWKVSEVELRFRPDRDCNTDRSTGTPHYWLTVVSITCNNYDCYKHIKQENGKPCACIYRYVSISVFVSACVFLYICSPACVCVCVCMCLWVCSKSDRIQRRRLCIRTHLCLLFTDDNTWNL